MINNPWDEKQYSIDKNVWGGTCAKPGFTIQKIIFRFISKKTIFSKIYNQIEYKYKKIMHGYCSNHVFEEFSHIYNILFIWDVSI